VPLEPEPVPEVELEPELVPELGFWFEKLPEGLEKERLPLEKLFESGEL
jgi:hypothetical protein